MPKINLMAAVETVTLEMDIKMVTAIKEVAIKTVTLEMDVKMATAIKTVTLEMDVKTATAIKEVIGIEMEAGREIKAVKETRVVGIVGPVNRVVEMVMEAGKVKAIKLKPKVQLQSH